MTDLAPIAGRLARLMRMLSSDKPGEVVNAASAMIRTLRSAGADIHVLADLIQKPSNGNGKISEKDMRVLYEAGYRDGLAAAEEKKFNGGDFRGIDISPHEMALFCQERSRRLSDCEEEFINSVAARTVWRAPTEKQEKWLKSIFLRLGGRL